VTPEAGDGIDNRPWYRAEHRRLRGAQWRHERRKLLTTRALIGVLLVGAALLAAPLLGNAARNMACSNGFALTVVYVGGDCGAYDLTRSIRR
jgi:hypothetical protein